MNYLEIKGLDGNVDSFWNPTYSVYSEICKDHDLDMQILIETIRKETKNGAHSFFLDVRVYEAYQRGILDERKSVETLYHEGMEAFWSYAVGEDLVYDDETLIRVHKAVRRALAGTSKDLPAERRDHIANDVINECLNDGIKFREVPVEDYQKVGQENLGGLFEEAAHRFQETTGSSPISESDLHKDHWPNNLGMPVSSDPTYGRIDRDIQWAVQETYEPISTSQRTVLEMNLQRLRDQGHTLVF